MTNPNPEGLPSRIELGAGWHLLLVHTGGDVRFPDYIICEPEGDRLGMTAKHVGELKVGLNAHTDALGAALEAMLNHDPKHRTYSPEVEAMADAALKAWTAGR